MFVHLARIQHKVVFRTFHFNNYGGSYDTTMVLCRTLDVAVSSLTRRNVLFQKISIPKIPRGGRGSKRMQFAMVLGVAYPGYQSFFSRTVRIFGVGRKDFLLIASGKVGELLKTNICSVDQAISMY